MAPVRGRPFLEYLVEQLSEAGIEKILLLTGYRGGPAHDIEALAQAIVSVSNFATRHGDRFRSLEINPLRVLPGAGPIGSGVIALDAVIEMDPL